MKSTKSNRRSLWYVVQLLLALSVLGGCRSKLATEHRVESSIARDTLQAVLSSWQEGETPESWQKKSPQVVVQDMDWKNGAKLKSFEILGEGEAIDANLHCQVKLRFLPPHNGKSESQVTYLVGTSPVLTVFRSFGQ